MSKSIRPFKEITLLEVAEVMSKRSTCQRRRVGCVIANEYGWVLACAYNGVARGISHCTEDTPCPGVNSPSGTNLDACAATHGEQSAIAQLRFPLEAYALVVTTSPCVSCVKLILITNIRHILYIEEYPQPEAKELWLKSPGRYWNAVKDLGNSSIFKSMP